MHLMRYGYVFFPSSGKRTDGQDDGGDRDQRVAAAATRQGSLPGWTRRRRLLRLNLLQHLPGYGGVGVLGIELHVFAQLRCLSRAVAFELIQFGKQPEHLPVLFFGSVLHCGNGALLCRVPLVTIEMAEKVEKES